MVDRICHRAERNDSLLCPLHCFLGAEEHSLDIDKLSPRFQVTSEPLHETGVTVPAAMSAPDIRVDTVVKTGDSRFGQNGLGEDFSYLHINYYNGVVNKSKGLLLPYPIGRRRKHPS
jgi:hypothetical protein